MPSPKHVDSRIAIWCHPRSPGFVLICATRLQPFTLFEYVSVTLTSSLRRWFNPQLNGFSYRTLPTHSLYTLGIAARQIYVAFKGSLKDHLENDRGEGGLRLFCCNCLYQAGSGDRGWKMTCQYLRNRRRNLRRRRCVVNSRVKG